MCNRSYHHWAVLGAAGDDLIIVGAPVNIQHWTGVPAHCRAGFVDASRL